MNTSAQIQAEKDRAHEARMRSHYEMADAETRAELRRLGIVKERGGKIIATPRDFNTFAPDESKHKGGGFEEEEEKEVQIEHRENISDNLVGQLVSAHLRVLVAELLAAKNKSLYIECLSFASGVIYEGDTESEIAKRHGLTRAAASKKVKEIQLLFNLPPRASARKLTTCKRYVERANRVHLRNEGQFC